MEAVRKLLLIVSNSLGKLIQLGNLVHNLSLEVHISSILAFRRGSLLPELVFNEVSTLRIRAVVLIFEFDVLVDVDLHLLDFDITKLLLLIVVCLLQQVLDLCQLKLSLFLLTYEVSFPV